MLILHPHKRGAEMKKLRRRNSIELYPPDLGKIKIRIKGSNNVVRIGKLGAVPGRCPHAPLLIHPQRLKKSTIPRIPASAITPRIM